MFNSKWRIMRAFNKIIIILFIIILTATAFPESWELVVFFNNDRHGGIAPGPATFINPETPPPLGKLPSEAALINKFRAETQSRGHGFLLIDQGDTYQGAPVGSLTKGEAVVLAFNEIMPDAVIPGNHEFDDGTDNFRSLIQKSEFQWVAANIIDVNTGKLFQGLEPYIIREFPISPGQNIKIGIIGLTTYDTKTMSFPENTADIEILDELQTANTYAETLKAKGCDFIIVCAHIGLPFDPEIEYLKLQGKLPDADGESPYGGIGYIELASKFRNIDVAFGGHIHLGYREPWEDPETHVLVFQNYAHGGNTGAIRFKFDPETMIFLGYEPIAYDDALITLFSDDFWEDPDMKRFIDSLANESENGLLEPVAKANGAIMRGDAAVNQAGHIMCDAMIMVTNADVSITNMGGVRADFPAGTITKKDVFTVMPFDNKIVAFELSGSVIKEVIENLSKKYNGALVGGAKIVYDLSKSEGERIVEMKIGGESYRPDKIYTFATTDYIYYSYGIPQLQEVSPDNVRFTGILLRDAMEKWMRDNSPIEPGADDRWLIIQ